MASSGARFKITQGSTVSPSTDRGFSAVSGTTLKMQLEASPVIDVRSCVFEILRPTKDAPSFTLSASGIASPQNAEITMSMPAGIYSFVLRCTTNSGEPVRTSTGQLDYSVNIFERIVSVPNRAGRRKIIAGETLEFHPTRGWTDDFNDLVDAEDSGAATVGSDVIVGGDAGIPGSFIVKNVDGSGNALVVSNASSLISLNYPTFINGYLLLPEIATPPAAPSGMQRIFIDQADHKLKRINSSSVVVDIG